MKTTKIKHRGRSDRTPRKLKKSLAKQGLVEIWLDLDHQTKRRLAMLAESMGLENPSSKKSIEQAAIHCLVSAIAEQKEKDRA